MNSKKIIAKKELDVIGGNPQVFCYYNDGNTVNVDILSSSDRPYHGVTSYATIGLSDYEIGLTSNDKSLRVELLGACDAKDEFFANIVATTAFGIIEKKKCSYGVIISCVISEYHPDSDMKHVYLMNPFLWDGFETIEFENKKVAWLLLVPISEKERVFALTNGWEALEDRFEASNIDVFNINRKSII